MNSIGWIDFSKRDRDKVRGVLDLLEEPGAVDELGVGAVRDAFSDILFPGTSTQQTRAKYLFLVPYICKDLERGDERLRPDAFIARLEEKEIKLIKVLDEDGAEGVIGRRAKEKLQQKPSSRYWSGLRTFGIFNDDLSLSSYAAKFCGRKGDADSQKKGGRRREEGADADEPADDSDTGMLGVSFWRGVPYSRDWEKGVNINLTAEEAGFLREKIISSPNRKVSDSLLALVLRENRKSFAKFTDTDFEKIDELKNIMPAEMWRDYTLARDFSRFVFGAQIRYNVIYSGGKNEDANLEWKEYIKKRPSVNLDDVEARLVEARRLRPHSGVMKFLRSFQQSLDDTGALDKLIIDREKELKGAARAKLTNKELYEYREGESINMVPLTYRLRTAVTIVRDIFEGMGNNA
jgi:predicted nucleic acid-binding protein